MSMHVRRILSIASCLFAVAAAASAQTGATVSDPGRTCRTIHEAYPASPDGVYWLDPDYGGPIAPFEAQCDMTRAGGGWTLGVKTWYQAGHYRTAAAVGTVADALTLKGNPYKLSDDAIRSIIGPALEFDILGDQAGFNSAYSTGNYEYIVLRNYTGTWRWDGPVAASATPTAMESRRASDGVLAWSGQLLCGYGGAGINCYDVLSGPNPAGGAGCTISMGSQTNAAWHHFYMAETNSDTYVYVCNGAQHSSGFNMNHRFWFREPSAITGTIVLRKETDPDGHPQAFQLDTSEIGTATTTLSDGGSATFIDLMPGTYRVDETLPAGWTLDSVTCEVDNGSNSTGSADATGVDIVLNAAQTVTCTFHNFANATGLAPTGSTSSDPARTCRTIKDAYPALPDGVYWLDPDGGGPIAPFQARCDMTRDGGGWTFGVKNWYLAGHYGNTGAVGSVSDALTLKGNPYKLSDEAIRAVIGPGQRFDVLADQAGYNSWYSTGNYEYTILRNYTGQWSWDGPVPASSTPTTMESHRLSDGALAWTGELLCGAAGAGINCGTLITTPSPAGGSGCSINMGLYSDPGYHHLYMAATNSDTYMFLCNGPQHSSSHNMNHRFWFREPAPPEEPEPVITTRTVTFDVYNQGRAAALPSQVRAFVSDHDSLETHTLGTGSDEELAISIVAPPACETANCTPALLPGESAHYTAELQLPLGGFGRHAITDEEGNQADETPEGFFTLTSSDSTFSKVSFYYGRHVWVHVDSGCDLSGARLDESGQLLEPLLRNDAKAVLFDDGAPTFAGLAHLSATFSSLSGGSGGGTPRLEVHFGAQGKIGIRLGAAPGFNDTDATLNLYSGVNVIGNNDTGRYDLSALAGGPASATYADARSAAGAYTITRIDFVADDGPAREYTLEKINVFAASSP